VIRGVLPLSSEQNTDEGTPNMAANARFPTAVSYFKYEITN